MQEYKSIKNPRFALGAHSSKTQGLRLVHTPTKLKERLRKRKIMEEKKEALRKAASESTIADSTLQDKLAELNSIKPRPYGTIHAVSLFDFHFNSLK